MHRNKGIMGISALAGAALMIAGMTAFASDAMSITDNREYTAAINTVEVSIDALNAVGENAGTEIAYVKKTGMVIGETLEKNIEYTQNCIKKIKKAEEAEQKKKEEEKKKAEEEKKKAEEEKKKKEEQEKTAANTVNAQWDQSGQLSTFSGIYYGPSGKETYYNLDMSGIVSIMRGMGYSEDAYPYWVRDDGCKMFGDYIMVACNLDIRPRGTLVATSLGTGIVVDTSPVFVGENATQVDVAVTW